MKQMEALEVSGTAAPEELAAVADELSGKMLRTTWLATRWEVTQVSSGEGGFYLSLPRADNQVLGPVIDQVLHGPGISKDVALKRAQAILVIGEIFKSILPDEDDAERRELERLVQNAAGKKKKDKSKRSAFGVSIHKESGASTPAEKKSETEAEA
jgi:hypothetical protein